MKELSIEEKAKRYDEALERAKTSFESANGMILKKWLVDIFTELKESKDEKIRKELITHCRNTRCVTEEGAERIAKWIAWLEKQCTPAKLSEEEQNRFAKGVLTSCALSFIDYLDAHKYEGKMCVSNGECEDIENAFHNAMWDRLHRYYCKYIEKQGEQKPTLPKWKYKKDNTPLSRDSLTLNKYGCMAKSPSGTLVSDVWVIDYDELAKLPKEEYEKQGEQKPAENKGMNLVEEEMTPFQKKVFCIIDTTIEEEQGLKQVCDELLTLASNEIKQKPTTEIKSAEESLGIDSETYNKIVDECIYGEQKPAETEKGAKGNDREIPFSGQEWSEEDEKILNLIIARLHSHPNVEAEEYGKDYHWLKALKDRHTWKPSDEQMEALRKAEATIGVNHVVLAGLISDLEKLKG